MLAQASCSLALGSLSTIQLAIPPVIAALAPCRLNPSLGLRGTSHCGG